MEENSQGQGAGLIQAPKARKLFLILELPFCNEVFTKQLESELIPVNGVENYYQIRPWLMGQVCTTPLFTPDDPSIMPAKKQRECGICQKRNLTIQVSYFQK